MICALLLLRSRCGKGVIGIAQVVRIYQRNFAINCSTNIAILSTRLNSACAKDKILPAEI